MGKRYLIDSNTLIEFTAGLLPETSRAELSSIIDSAFNISFINKIEVPGHRTVNPVWVNFINKATIIKLDEDVIEQTILIRKRHSIKLPDAIIAATTMVHDLILVTRNVVDFKRIEGLQVDNPWLWVK